MAAEMARTMKELEEELVSFLLASGPEVEAVAARMEQAEDHFGWADPLHLLDPEGRVRDPHRKGLLEGGSGKKGERSQRRFTNLLRRAKAQASIEGTAGHPCLTHGRQPTRRFSVSGPLQGIHVLINLQPDRLWVTYHLKASVVVRILSSAPGAIEESVEGTLRLIDPRGSVVYASRPDAEGKPVTQVAAIETAPQWAVEVLLPLEKGQRQGQALSPLVYLLLGATASFFSLVWVLRRRLPKVPQGDPSTDHIVPDSVATSDIATEKEPQTEQYRIGDAVIDLDRYLVVRGDTEHPLTDREVALLRLLLATPNQVIRRQRMLEEVWGYSSEVTTRTVDTFVYRLRQKIEADPQAPRHFLTIRGAGYRFVP